MLRCGRVADKKDQRLTPVSQQLLNAQAASLQSGPAERGERERQAFVTRQFIELVCVLRKEKVG